MLAVEIFNKPLVTFKTEAFVTLMVNAWNKLFLAYFIKIDEPYYEERDSGKWTYDLEKCINRYKAHKTFDLAVEKNLLLCKGFRDYVEHEVLNIDLDNHRQVEIFQALLFNYEEFIAENFGKEFVINQSLSISLQFSDYEDITLGKVKNQFIKYAEKNGLEEFINSKCSAIEKDVLESRKFKVKLVPQSVEVSNTKDFDLELSFKESVNDSNSSLAVVKKIVTKDVSGKDYKLMKFSVESINKSLEEKGIDVRVNRNHLISINQMFAVNGRNGNKLDTLTQYCIPDTSRLNEEESAKEQMKKVSCKYHIERYPKFILSILEKINYDVTFINKNRLSEFSHNDFGSLSAVFSKYSKELSLKSVKNQDQLIEE
jgi:hypothetical protein